VQGRDWTSLALVAPGNRTTAMGSVPVQDRGDVREFQLNMDGQQVTQDLGTGVQPRYSQDSIAEFQFISNRFDATMGRSSGVQVMAITRSGTNNLAGTFRGNFRDSKFNSEDPVTGVVLPMQNQQYSTAVGGPIIRDRLHFFGNYEYERGPKTSIFTTPYPSFNVTLSGKETIKMGGARIDYQASPSARLMGKWHEGRRYDPFGAGNSNHPSATGLTDEASREILGQFTVVLGNRAVNEVKAGYSEFGFDQGGLTHWSNHWLAPLGITQGSPRIRFNGFNMLPNANFPRTRAQNVWSAREDFTFSYEARGRHDLRVGAEYLRRAEESANRRTAAGELDSRGGPIPANIEALFPDAFNVDTWNLAALSPITRRYTIGVGNFDLIYTQPKFGTWIQDDWHMTNALTLNLGLRYDLSVNVSANDIEIKPFLPAGRPDDTNNFQPRFGFAYTLTDRTVLRGGYGRYYGDLITGPAGQMNALANTAVVDIPNDGRPDFPANPFNGPWPTRAQLEQRFCSTAQTPTCIRRDTGENSVSPIAEFTKMPYAHQASIGLQRQVASTMSVEADYVYVGGRDERSNQGAQRNNVNMTYDPVTGVNYPYTDISRRPFPDWGPIYMNVMGGRSNSHGLQTAFTKRLSNRWQASGTYTLSWLYDMSAPAFSGVRPVPFHVQPDLGNDYGYSASDQRHRATLNGIWQVGRGFQMSGLYFYGSGQRYSTTYGGDLRLCGQGCDRLRPDGTIVPRNNFVGAPLHRVDLRFQQRLKVGGRVSLDGILEAYNLFNHENFGNYEVRESNANYGKPIPLLSLVYQPRMLQLGFRATF